MLADLDYYKQRRDSLPLPEIDYNDEHAIQREMNKLNAKKAEISKLIIRLRRKKRMLTTPLSIPKDKYIPETLQLIKKLFPQIYSVRELEIIYWIGQFKTEQQISDILFVSKKTVKFHKTNIYSKLDVKNEKELQAKIYEAKK